MSRIRTPLADAHAENARLRSLLSDARAQLGGTVAILLPILEKLDVDIDETTITINRVGPNGKTPIEKVSLRDLIERNVTLDTILAATLNGGCADDH